MKNKDNKKIIIIISIVLTILIILGFFISYLYYYNINKFKANINKPLGIETGMNIDKIKKLIKDSKGLDNIDISLKKINDNSSVVIRVKYYKNGKEVDKRKAVEVVNGKEKLKKGYIKKEEIVGVGRYDVFITDKKTKKTYRSTINIKDTKAPKLILKDVEIEEGSSIDVKSFVSSCRDNSNEECSYQYVNNKGEKLDNIDMSVGERTINIVASDKSKNKSKICSAKLKVNEKSKEVVAEKQSLNQANKSFNNKESGNTGGYDASNPVVAKALSLVGQSMNCTVLVEQSLQAAGKSLARDNIPCSHPIFQEPELVEIAKNACAYNPNAGQYVWGINVVKYFGIPVGSPSPGDVLFYANGGSGGKHVAIYIGNGQAVHGGWKGNNVVISSMYVSGASSPQAYRM